MTEDREDGEEKRRSRFRSLTDRVNGSTGSDAAATSERSHDQSGADGDSAETDENEAGTDDLSGSDGTETDSTGDQKRSETETWEWVGDSPESDTRTADAGRVWNPGSEQEVPDGNDSQKPTEGQTRAAAPDPARDRSEPSDAEREAGSEPAETSEDGGSVGEKTAEPESGATDRDGAEREGSNREGSNREGSDRAASGTDVGRDASDSRSAEGGGTESTETQVGSTESADDRADGAVSASDRRRSGIDVDDPDRSGDAQRGESDGQTDSSASTTVDSGGSPEPVADSPTGSTGRRSRVWNRDDPTTPSDADATELDPPIRDSTASSTDGTGSGDRTEGYQPPAGLDIEPGMSALIQCGSQDERKHDACHDLLGIETAGTGRNVLLIRYQKIRPERLERIAESAHNTKLIAVGYSQQIPESVRAHIDTASIHNPNDITRLGILVSGTMNSWKSSDRETVVCYDSINVLLEYKDTQNTFRFLHIFLGTLAESGAVAHFHADPLAGDPQKINTLKPLFDSVVTIDSMGIEIE